MNLQFKRLAALAISHMIILCSLNITFAEDLKYNPDFYNEASGVVNTLGIYSGSGEISQIVTRYSAIEALTDLAVQCSHVQAGDIDAGNYFSDIGDEQKEAVGIAIKCGMITIPRDGLFHPDDAVDFEFITYAASSVIGYTEEMKKNPLADRKLRADLGDNLRSDFSSGITTGDLCVIIYNLLNQNYMKMYESELSDESILSGVFRTGVLKARMIADNQSDINDNIAILSDDVIFKSGNNEYMLSSNNADYSEFMGRMCKVYYNVDTDEIIYICAESDDLKEYINADEFDGFSLKDRRISYRVAASGSHWGRTYKQKSIVIPQGTDIIYNGQFTLNHEAVYNILEGNSLNVGDIKLYDTNNDGKVDLMNVSAYYDVRVDMVDSKDGAVFDVLSGRRIDFVPEDESSIKLQIINDSGNKTDFSNFAKNDILSVYEGLSDYKMIKIVQCSEKISGTVSSVYDDGGIMTVKVDDESYKLSKTYQQYSSGIEIGNTYNFLLNSSGAIASFIPNDAVYDTIGAVVSATKMENSDTAANITIFTVNGEIKKFVTRDKWYVENCRVYESDSALYYKLSGSEHHIRELKTQFVQFKVDAENHLVRIDFPKENAQEGELSYTLGMNYTEEVYDNPGAYVLRYKTNGRYFFPKDAGSSCMNFIGTTSNTKFIKVPSKAVEGTDEDDYSVAGSIANDEEVACVGYTFTPGNAVADVVVLVSDGASKITNGSYNYVIKSISQAINKEEDIGYKIEAYSRTGSIMTFETEDLFVPEYDMNTAKLTGNESDLGIGDTIKVSVTANGLCSSVAKIYDADEKKSYFTLNPNYWYAGDRMIYGSVYSVNDTALAYYVGKEPEGLNPKGNIHIHGIRTDNVVIVVDLSKKGDERVITGSSADIIGYTADKVNYSHILLSTGYGEQNLLVCYK
ncbi:MAG: hypothetical protein J6N52_13760 [Clostridia bacterium]|nr:hypothetical protein [Clostridia bacterium]